MPVYSTAVAQALMDGQTSESEAVDGQTQTIPFEKRSQINYDAYILGPGDGLQIELLDLPELAEDSQLAQMARCIYLACVPCMWKG